MEAPDSRRFKLILHYDGAAFHGWQLQPDQRTVQGDLESALSRIADRPVRVTGAGRTDTGVHATGQVAAVDMPAAWTAAGVERSLNALVGDDLWIASVVDAPSDFHPRFDAILRTYEYTVGTDRAAASPFRRRTSWALAESLDPDLLDASASEIVGEHSFRAFAKAGQPERGDVCAVRDATWEAGASSAVLSISADRYLHHMVRYLVGTMVDIARGRRPVEDMARLLRNEDGFTTSPPAPPEGLTLVRVDYPSASHRDGIEP